MSQMPLRRGLLPANTTGQRNKGAVLLELAEKILCRTLIERSAQHIKATEVVLNALK